MTLLDIQTQINKLQIKKREMATKMLDKRPQYYIAERAGINKTRFNHWLNATFEFDEDEIKKFTEAVKS